MTDEIDQDAREAADAWDESLDAEAIDLLAADFARMKAAGREQGLREAAAKCLEVSGLIGAGYGSSIDSALCEAAAAIEALLSEKPA